MNLKILFRFLGAIFAICIILIILISCFLEDQTNLRDGLIAEIVGGGIIGAIVAGTLFYLQESDEYQTNKKEAISFYEDKLLLDINEVFDRSPSPYNFSGIHKFYYDHSRINSLYDVYESNFKEINNYTAYYPENSLVKTFNDFYREARKGYVLGEKLEGAIYQIVRSENHKRQLIDANDPRAQAYLKGSLFAEMSDTDVMRYLDWQSVPGHIPQIVEVFNKNTQAKELLGEVKTARKNLLKREQEIEKLLRDLQKRKEGVQTTAH